MALEVGTRLGHYDVTFLLGVAEGCAATLDHRDTPTVRAKSHRLSPILRRRCANVERAVPGRMITRTVPPLCFHLNSAKP